MAGLPTPTQPASMQITSLSPTGKTVNPALFRIARYEDIHRYGFNLTYPAMNRETAMEIFAWLASFRGRFLPFWFTPPQHGSPLGSGDEGNTILTQNRENRVKWSEDYSQSEWIKYNVVGGGVYVRAPDGETEARLWRGNGSGGSHSIDQTYGTIKDHNVMAAYFKKYDATICRMDFYNHSSAINHYLHMQWVAGVLTEFGTLNIDDYGIDFMGDGWYRAWIYCNIPGENGDIRRPTILTSEGGAHTLGIFPWGIQVTEALTAPIGYVKTEADVVTNKANEGRVLYTDGWPTGQGQVLKAGDFLKLAGHEKVYEIRRMVNTDDAGNGAINIHPALITTVADDEEVFTDPVRFRVAVDADQVQVSIDKNSHFRLSVPLMEVIQDV